jgi:hypothetical protein
MSQYEFRFYDPKFLLTHEESTGLRRAKLCILVINSLSSVITLNLGHAIA